ncbi:MAG: PilW family protein [gamma proteobacterium symbiont of Bathyaustriella thionipta]|nr:PilW family protein [gamma proteobacterium symbiont of Bathyaustriella thionipta]
MKPSHHQSAFTLVELMIAMILSIVLFAAISQVYLGSKQAFNSKNAQSRIQENGRFAITLLRRNLLNAGAGLLSYSDRPVIARGIHPEDARDDLFAEYWAPTDISQCDDGLIIFKDQLFRVFFRIDEDESGNPGLFCSSNKYDEGVMLVDGVEHMRIRLAIDKSAKLDHSKNLAYRSSSDIYASSEEDNVYAVHIALLVRSPKAILRQDSQQHYQLFDISIDKNDRYTRQLFFTTIPLRNRML